MVKTDTLKKNYEFKNVLKKGNYFPGKYIDIYIQKNRKSNNYIGIAISVKVAKATKRNRIKRLIRENYRLIENNIVDGYNIIFLWKKKIDIKEATYNNIEEDMLSIFQRAKLLKNKEE